MKRIIPFFIFTFSLLVMSVPAHADERDDSWFKAISDASQPVVKQAEAGNPTAILRGKEATLPPAPLGGGGGEGPFGRPEFGASEGPGGGAAVGGGSGSPSERPDSGAVSGTGGGIGIATGADATSESSGSSASASSGSSESSGGGFTLMVLIGMLGNPDALEAAGISASGVKDLIIAQLPETRLPPEVIADLVELLNRADDRGILLSVPFLSTFLRLIRALQEELLGEIDPEDDQILEPGWFNKYSSCSAADSPAADAEVMSATFIAEHNSSDTAFFPSSSRIFDTSRTFEFAGREWFPSTDNPDDPTIDYHGLNKWQFFCFGNREECFPIQATPLQYGCGGVRARVVAEPGTALFDSPGRPSAQRRVPGLVR